MDSTGTSPDVALAECRVSIESGIGSTSHKREELRQFIELFRKDFTSVLSKEAEAWDTDRDGIMTLARAIGAYAAFLALSDESTTAKTVGLRDLKAAYGKLSPDCRIRAIRRKYCESVAGAVPVEV